MSVPSSPFPSSFFVRLIKLSLLGILLASCSSGPAVHYSIETRYEAAKFAVVENTKLQAIVDACSEIGKTSMQYAQQVQRQWWQRNWQFIGPADSEMTNHVKMMQHNYGEILGQLDMLFFYRQIKERDAKELKNRIVKTNNRENSCRRRLEPYLVEENDLEYDETYADILQTIRMDYLNDSVSPPRDVPSFKTTVAPVKNLGRSLRSVENMVEEKFCMNYLVVNLHNKWPKETYGALCNGRAKAVFDCTWGACKVTEQY